MCEMRNASVETAQPQKKLDPRINKDKVFSLEWDRGYQELNDIIREEHTKAK